MTILPIRSIDLTNSNIINKYYYYNIYVGIFVNAFK